MSAPTIDEATAAVADPKAYADDDRIHAALRHLRETAPVARVEAPGYNPFWAVTKHADILAVERDHTLFTNSPRPVLMTAEEEALQAAAGIRTLIHIDDPDHKAMRAIAMNWFRPKALKAMKDRIDELAGIHVDKLAAAGGECDFVQEIAVNFPLFVIMSLLGVPEEDFPRMLRLTQELLGSQDSERQRSATPEEEMAAILDMFDYFTKLAAARREHPTEDMASTIANATIDGEPLTDLETVSYYLLIATAGHDTTSSTISGGMRALIEHPDQRALLTEEPDLMPTATEEMVRWVTPVKAFMRTAARDAEVGGVPVAAGDALLLSYVSGNRDEDAFDDPYRFDVSRTLNRHVAFGFGVHFCLGAALARMEISSFFSQLLPRLRSVELAGEPEQIASTFVGGLKRLPIRYTMR